MTKKKSNMTPMERLDRIMEGATWEEAEEVGIEILARCFALHAYSRHDGEKFFDRMLERIAKRGDEWAHENTFVLAMAAIGNRLDKLKN